MTLGILLLFSFPQDTGGWEIGGRWSAAHSLTSRAPASSSPCHGALKKRLHQRGVLAPKIRFCQLPAPIRVALLLLCRLPLDVCTQCHPQVTQPRPPVLAPIVVWQRAGPGCAGTTSSFYNIWLQISSGGLRAGRATPKLPLPLRSAAFARLPTLGNTGLAGEASAPSHRNYRLPWGSGASCNNSLVSWGLRVIMGWTQPSQHPDPGMSPQPVPAPRPWLWVPSGLSVCPFIPGPAELRRRIP